MKKNNLTRFTLLLIFGFCISWFITPSEKDFHTYSFSELPIIEKGRVKSWDTLARTAILFIQGKQKVMIDDNEVTPIEWLLYSVTQPKKADSLKIFRLQHPGVMSLLNLTKESGKYHSFQTIKPYLPQVIVQAQQIQDIEREKRSRYQSAIMELYAKVNHYQVLKQSFYLGVQDTFSSDINDFVDYAKDSHGLVSSHLEGQRSEVEKQRLEKLLAYFKTYKQMADISQIHLIPEQDSKSLKEWKTMGDGVLVTMKPLQLSPVVSSYMTLFDAYKSDQKEVFNAELFKLKKLFSDDYPEVLEQTRLETNFNRFDFFYKSMVLYVIVFVLVLFSWLIKSTQMNLMAYQLSWVVFSLHTVGIVLRMILQSRPPVTNLYSSAIFVGWVAILFGLLLEKHYKNGFGSIVGAVVGFVTLMIAHHLSLTGDTLEMMQAVLDTNIWLATHVVIITMGYGATIVAGILAHFYIFKGILSRDFEKKEKKNIYNMVFASNCAAILFMFIGTVLGGIWADQSWGRFWGWDPKENGALMIVLWLAILLHARIGGYIKERGMMIMSIVSNIVTSFSWFGVNMLGIGLHSYGFMEKTFFWLMLFIFTQLFMMWLGFLPKKYWKSIK